MATKKRTVKTMKQLVESGWKDLENQSPFGSVPFMELEGAEFNFLKITPLLDGICHETLCGKEVTFDAFSRRIVEDDEEWLWCEEMFVKEDENA